MKTQQTLTDLCVCVCVRKRNSLWVGGFLPYAFEYRIIDTCAYLFCMTFLFVRVCVLRVEFKTLYIMFN